jgi:hypothetical protein
MRTPKRSSLRRSCLVFGTLLMFGAPTIACSVDLGPTPPNPRLGKEKRILFSSGCSSSVTMPVGATDTITMQSPEENGVLPADLVPTSVDPAVIEVLQPSATTFDMHALKKGQTDISVSSAGARFDSITFRVEPAKSVTATSKETIIAGGRTGIAIENIFGSCGAPECEMFGHTFMKWSADPASSFTFLEDTKNLAHYRASMTPGKAALIGNEPSEGQELVRHEVEIIDPAKISGLLGSVEFTVNGNGTDSPLPATIPVGSGSLAVRIFGERAGASAVPISRHDLEWTVPSGWALVPQPEPADPFIELFATNDTPGSYMLTAKVAILGGQAQTFMVTIKAP